MRRELFTHSRPSLADRTQPAPPACLHSHAGRSAFIPSPRKHFSCTHPLELRRPRRCAQYVQWYGCVSKSWCEAYQLHKRDANGNVIIDPNDACPSDCKATGVAWWSTSPGCSSDGKGDVCARTCYTPRPPPGLPPAPPPPPPDQTTNAPGYADAEYAPPPCHPRCCSTEH